jgi:hypothetical protein
LAPTGGNFEEHGSQSSILDDGSSQDREVDGESNELDEDDSGSNVVEVIPTKKRKRMPTVEPEALQVEGISTSVSTISS